MRNHHYLAERLFLPLSATSQPLLQQYSFVLCLIFDCSRICQQLLWRFASDTVDDNVYLFVSRCILKQYLSVRGVELLSEGVLAAFILLIGLPAPDDEEDKLTSDCVVGGQCEQVEEL